MTFDYCVIGGGIVGLATAMGLLKKRPGSSLLILEKELNSFQHQTGRNSGVIHSGIYYPPGSLKSDLCRRGASATMSFCEEHAVPFEMCGKLLVATNSLERERMNSLLERAKMSGIAVEKLDSKEMKRREPNIVGLGALFVSSTGIVDYKIVVEKMGNVVRSRGGEIKFGVNVNSIQEFASEVLIGADESYWTCKRLIACAGLQSDRLARIAGCKVDHQIIPFRGEYYRLPVEKDNIVKHLIYPIPDPNLPFLGIHLTRLIGGGVTVGPNAVLGFAREGYPKFSFDLRDVSEYCTFPGFWRTIVSNLGSGLTEIKNSLSKYAYLKECQKYCPSLTIDDLLPEQTGIRAKR